MQTISDELSRLQVIELDAGQIFSGNPSGTPIKGYATPSLYTPRLDPNYLFHESSRDIIVWLLSTVTVFVFGRRFFTNSIRQLSHGAVNMDTLVASSTSIAYFFSVFNLFYPEFWTSRGLEAHLYFESASMIIAFILIGRCLENRAKQKTSDAIEKLMTLQPGTVRVERNGKEETLPLAEIVPGDIVISTAGSRGQVWSVPGRGSEVCPGLRRRIPYVQGPL